MYPDGAQRVHQNGVEGVEERKKSIFGFQV
jgi:hypothetical protein